MRRGRLALTGAAAIALAALVASLLVTFSGGGGPEPEPERSAGEPADLYGASIWRESSDSSPRPAREYVPPPARYDGPLTGVVRFRDGDRVAGAEVRVIWNDGTAGPTVVTDGNGYFEIEGVPPDGCHLEISGRAKDGTLVLPEVTRLLIPQPRDVRIIVRRGEVIAGRVVDEQERPFAGAEVEARTGRKPAGKPYRMVRSGEDGTFELIVAQRSSYHVRAVVPSTEDTGFPYAQAFSRKVAPGTRDLRIVLTAGQEIRGMLVSSRGDEVSGVPLVVEPTSSRLTFYGKALARTDDWGQFRIRGLRRTRYRISIDAERYADRTRAVVGGDVVLAPTEDVRLELVEAGSFSGILLDAAGKPAERRRMSFRHATLESWRACETSSTGAFRLEGAPVGTWKIRATESEARHAKYMDCGSIATGDEGVEIRMPAK
ncbi:MAG: carboxypeptidase-like regulatory domain-containing protein [Planctomycetota bacterium]|jgi:hypothetical protein